MAMGRPFFSQSSRQAVMVSSMATVKSCRGDRASCRAVELRLRLRVCDRPTGHPDNSQGTELQGMETAVCVCVCVCVCV